MSGPRKQTAPAEMRSTDKEGEDTEDERTLSRDGWNLPHSPAIVSYFQSLHLRCFLFLCVAARKVGPPLPRVDESQLFFLIISGTPVCMCVCAYLCACVRILYFYWSSGIRRRDFSWMEKNESGKGSCEGQKWKERHIITHILMTPVVSNMGQLTKNKEAIGFQHGN